MPKRERSISTVRPLAPEEIRRGKYVCVTRVTHEFVPWTCLEGNQPARVERVTVRACPEPLLVEEVCLPLILVREGDGTLFTLDARRAELARVPRRVGDRAHRLMRRAAKKRSDC